MAENNTEKIKKLEKAIAFYKKRGGGGWETVVNSLEEQIDNLKKGGSADIWDWISSLFEDKQKPPAAKIDSVAKRIATTFDVPKLAVQKKLTNASQTDQSPEVFIRSLLKSLDQTPIEKRKVAASSPTSPNRKTKEATFRRNLKARELADQKRRDAARRSADRSTEYVKKIKKRDRKDLGESAVSEYMRSRNADKKDERDLAHRDSKGKYYPTKGTRRALKPLEGGVRYYTLPDWLGGGRVKVDSTFRDEEGDNVTHGKKGGQVKKGVKKTKAKARKRAALRGHRAELRGG